MSSRQVLITGAGGFVGASLSTGFADLGWGVIGLDRQFDVGGPVQGIRQVGADLSLGVPRDVPKVDLVVHAAWTTTDPETLGVGRADHMANNVRPLLSVLEYVSSTEPESFVLLSSSGVFDPGDGTEGLTDAHRPTGASAYAVAKRAGEILVPGALSPLTAAHVVRLGNLFGPGEVARPSRTRVSLVARWLAAARRGESLVVRSDNPLRDWTFTPDLAPALARMVAGPPAGGPVHLAGPGVLRDQELAALVASRLPGTETVSSPAVGRVKPPMVPSEIPALAGFAWTDPADGIEALLGEEVSA